MTVDEAAQVYRIGRRQAYAACNAYIAGDEGGIPCRKVGSRIVVLTGPVRIDLGVDAA